MSAPYDRPTTEHGGGECFDCGVIFIGAEWHQQCAVCLDQARLRGLDPSGFDPSRDYGLDDDELCDCCGENWDHCKNFFENWICGLMPDGSCSLAGTEECDWECPRHG